MKKISLHITVAVVLLSGCNYTVPSSHEIHYSKDLKDSIVFVNYNLSSDSSCNFYMNYGVFVEQFEGNNYEKVYKYHLSHPDNREGIDYKSYRRIGFYNNNNPDSAEYYQSGSSSNPQPASSSLKPTNSYNQSTRPYNYRKPR